MQGETQPVPRLDAVSDLGRVFFRPVHWQSAFEETVERLSQAIKLGAVVVGERLPSERELVSKLEVSRTTLREAIRALQQEGILRTQRGRSGGTFVASDGARILSRQEATRIIDHMGEGLHHLIDVRAAVEPRAAELAAKRVTAEGIERLRRSLERFRDVSVNELRKGDSLVHITIAELAASDLLMDAVLRVQSRLHDLLAFLSVLPTPKAAARRESRQHGTIVEAMAKRDSTGAREAMAKHIAATEDLLKGLMKRGSTSVSGSRSESRAVASS
jgi:DNA-binding FadR family transcriptional regulator